MNFLNHFRLTKTLKILFGFLIFVVITSSVLFTPWGNRILSPLIEKALSGGFSTPMSVREFTLTPKRFHLMAQDGYGNTLSTQGGISLLTLRLYAHYRLDCYHEKGMNPISVPFKTHGAINGGIASLRVQGNAHIFKGNLHYEGELRRFHLSNALLILDTLDYQSLLHLLEYPSDTDTTLSGTIALKGFDRRDVTGTIHLATLTDRFAPTPILKDDNGSFSLRQLLSDESGQLKAFKTDIMVDASFEHAGVLEQFVGMPLGGALKVHGTLKGDDQLLKLKVSSDVARSETKLTVVIPKLEPASASFSLHQADAEETFTLFALPSPITGKISVYADLNTTEGKVNVSIQEGATLPSVLKRHYQITQPLIRFDAQITAALSPKGVRYRAQFKSDLSRMEIDRSTTHDQMLRELLKTLR